MDSLNTRMRGSLRSSDESLALSLTVGAWVSLLQAAKVHSKLDIKINRHVDARGRVWFGEYIRLSFRFNSSRALTKAVAQGCLADQVITLKSIVRLKEWPPHYGVAKCKTGCGDAPIFNGDGSRA